MPNVTFTVWSPLEVKNIDGFHDVSFQGVGRKRRSRLPASARRQDDRGTGHSEEHERSHHDDGQVAGAAAAESGPAGHFGAAVEPEFRDPGQAEDIRGAEERQGAQPGHGEVSRLLFVRLTENCVWA